MKSILFSLVILASYSLGGHTHGSKAPPPRQELSVVLNQATKRVQNIIRNYRDEFKIRTSWQQNEPAMAPFADHTAPIIRKQRDIIVGQVSKTLADLGPQVQSVSQKWTELQNQDAKAIGKFASELQSGTPESEAVEAMAKEVFSKIKSQTLEFTSIVDNAQRTAKTALVDDVQDNVNVIIQKVNEDMEFAKNVGGQIDRGVQLIRKNFNEMVSGGWKGSAQARYDDLLENAKKGWKGAKEEERRTKAENFENEEEPTDYDDDGLWDFDDGNVEEGSP